MLSFLHIQGLAVIDELQLELSSGLNVLTGETGAGKSIIVGALSLLRGGKGSARAVRAECERALIQAQFVVPEAALVMQVLEGLELPCGEGERREVVLERVVPRSGRGRALVQGQLRPQPQLAEVGERLIDICGQHQQHSLARLGRHLELLDEHALTGNRRFAKCLGAYQQRYAELRGIERELERLREVLAQDPALGDYLEHQLKELCEVDPQPGEWEGVRERLESLRCREEILEAARLVEAELEECDGAVLSRLGALERQLRATGSGERFEPVVAALINATASCEEALAHARATLRDDDEGEESLQRLEERQHQLAVLRRKHGPELYEARERLEQQVAEWQQGAERIAELESARERSLAQALEVALELHQLRVDVAERLARAVEAELESLCMPLARIEIAVEQLAPERIHAFGVDRVEIRVAANPGEAAGPLSEVASGGELSRILLALQSVSNARGGIATYVFDEVDAGVGGAVADAIGRRLLRAARSAEGGAAQVLCITHLPQVAAFADAQFRVEKVVRAGRTRTRVVRLNEEERVEELARMLGGAEVTDSARHHAQRLLDAALALKSGKRASTRGKSKAKKRRAA
ncbi:MAG: DNA repair protein RecN [Polyangiaceae bacterium]|nr:DNA repair protein RecN [Polyangiaceae bacterium]